MIKLNLSDLNLTLPVVWQPAPFPGFNPREEAERRGFSRPLPSGPRP